MEYHGCLVAVVIISYLFAPAASIEDGSLKLGPTHVSFDCPHPKERGDLIIDPMHGVNRWASVWGDYGRGGGGKPFLLEITIIKFDVNQKFDYERLKDVIKLYNPDVFCQHADTIFGGSKAKDWRKEEIDGRSGLILNETFSYGLRLWSAAWSPGNNTACLVVSPEEALFNCVINSINVTLD